MASPFFAFFFLFFFASHHIELADCQRYKNESVTADKGLNADVSVYDTRLKYLKPFGKDPIFSELAFNEVDYDEKAKTLLQTVEEFQRGKRGAVQLGLMMKCATGCSPLDYNGYGCFCGFLGSGMPVDGIDKCCKMHDWCYTTTTCMGLQYELPYFLGFKWKCNGGAPYCIPGKTRHTNRDSCPHQLCECDREFAMCLSNFACPKSQAMCGHSKQRFLQNLITSLSKGNGMHDPQKQQPRHRHQQQQQQHHNHHHHQSRPRQPKKFNPFRINLGKK